MSPDTQKQCFVAYYRVSTARQGQSGLGLKAQQEAVSRFVLQAGVPLIDEFVEVETGKGKNALEKRPKLKMALQACRTNDACLLIAKLDRLGRNVYFIAGLMEANIDFLAVDCPTKDKFRLHLEACFAEEEARRISIRTKEALAACRARGQKLGKNGKALARKNKADANRLAKKLSPAVRAIRAEGHTTVRAIASEMNRRGIPSARGGLWSSRTVHRLLMRVGEVANG